jgi:hypothetical protein
MFLGLHFQGRQPGVRGCFLRRFGIIFEKDRGLIDLGAAYPAKDDEAGILSPFLALGMERTPRNEKGPGGGLAEDAIERVWQPPQRRREPR